MHPTIRRLLTSKWFLFSAGAFLLYTLIGFFLLPLAIGWYVPKAVHDQFQCQARLGKVRTNPFSMSFEITDFSLAGPDGAPMAGFARLFLNLEPSALIHRTAKVGEFHIDMPILHVVLEDDGQTNFSKVVPKSKALPSSSSESMPFLLQTFTMADGEVIVTDKRESIPQTLTFQDLDLKLKTLSTIRDKTGSYFLTATTQKGETIHVQGEIELAPFRAQGRLACQDIQADTLWGFARDTLGLESAAGKIDMNTEYRIDASNSPLELVLENFKLSLSGVSLKLARAEEAFFELNKLDVDSARLDFAKKTIQVGKVSADGGRLRYLVDDSGISNFAKIVRKGTKQGQKKRAPAAAKAQTQQAPPADAAPWTVDLQAIEVKKIGFDMVDMSRVPPLAAGVSSISINSSVGVRIGAKTDVMVRGISSELNGLRLGTKGAKDPVFEAQRFFVKGGEVDLGARTVTIPVVGLRDGHLDVGLEQDGKLNLEKLFASKIPAPEDRATRKATTDSGSTWKYAVKSLELSGFRSTFSDWKVNPESPLYQLQNIRLLATDIDGHSPMGVELGVDAVQGGTVTLEGKVNPEAQSLDAKIKVANLELTPIQPYLESYITLTLQSATLSAEGTFQYGAPEARSKIAYDGSFSLDKLRLSESGTQETYLGWETLQIPGLKLNVEPNNLRIKEARLKKPLGRLIIAEDRTFNLATIFKEQSAKKSAVPVPAKKRSAPAQAPREKAVNEQNEGSGSPFPYNIDKVLVEDGNIIFADLSLEPKFQTRIHNLKGWVSRLSSSPDSLAEIKLDGAVDQFGYAKVTGTLDLHDIKHSAELNMVFQNVELTSITPYAGKFAGRTIKSGKLSADLNYTIRDKKMLGNNKLIINNLELGKHVDSPEAINLPLDLAVALLTDSSGKMHIGLPVHGDLTDPQFSIGPLIWKAFSSLIFKTVTSPFRALGSLLGKGAGEKFDSVAFEPGRSELLPPEKEKLKKLSEALQKRPQLGLAVQGQYNPETDGLDFKQNSLHRAIDTLNGKKIVAGENPGPLDLDDRKTRQALEKIFEERLSAPALSKLKRGVLEGTVKPSSMEGLNIVHSKAGKQNGFGDNVNSAKLFKLLPGAKNPEQSALLAAEMFYRLVESEPVSKKELLQLAAKRAQAVATELEKTDGVPSERIAIKEPEVQTDNQGKTAAKLSLEALASSP